MKLEEISKGALISGIEPGKVARIVGIDRLGDNAVTVVYRTDDGRLGEPPKPAFELRASAGPSVGPQSP